MQKIRPNIWFDNNAEEAVDFYKNVFKDFKVIDRSFYPKTQEEGLADFQLDMAGKVLTIEFSINGQRFVAINAGSEFKPNPSISFMLNFDPSLIEDAESELDRTWAELSKAGKILMSLDSYPFSKKYGWIEDKYGVSWQLIFTDPDGEDRPFIIPSIMFSQENTNNAEEAINFYTSIFKGSKVGLLARYENDSALAKKGSIMFGDFQLQDQWFAAMDSGEEVSFGFNEGISFEVRCKDQAEIDYFWDKLSTRPEAEQCGWCKDKYGISWQIVPENIDELMKRPGAYLKMMDMKKLIIEDF